MSNLAEVFCPTLIRASAGSGKTFALSNRYIALLAHGERADKILATTFTRKAAGEILERVYRRLAEAALDAKAARILGSFIEKPNLSPADAQEILKRLTQQQARLNICTLDSFFISIAQSFSFELGLTPGWQLSDSAADASSLRQAIAGLCTRAAPEDLVELLSLLQKGNSRTAIHSQLERETQELYSAWRVTSEKAWDWLRVPKGLSPEELAACAEAIGKLPVPLTAKGEPDANWRNALADAGSAISTKNWNALLQKGLSAKLLAGESRYNKREITEEQRRAFEPVLTHLKAYFLGRLRAQTQASYRFLNLFAKELDGIRALSQTLNFEGVKQALVDARVMGELTELYYRLDTRISHLLLDEFQDTSRDEWLVLEPVVAEILSKAQGEQSFFCVGDTKQAIYGWRGGAAQIFETLEESFSILQRTAERRDESRRSALPIIETVNKVFSSLAQAQSLVEYPAVVEAWKSRFQEHTTALTELPGYVELRAVAAVSEDSDISDDILAAAADVVCELHSKNPQASIAVLLRGNDAVSRMLGKLWDRHVRASGEGGNPLTDSWYVGLVLSTLRLAEHPGDTISAYLIHNSALGKSLGLQDYASRTELEALSLRLRSEIEVEGLGEVIRGWVVLLSKEAPAHDRRRLRQLVELAYAYNYSRANRLNDFITWVKMTPVENPAASHVRVMTIHKSKGLEFDAVVLPELNGRVPKSLPSSLLRLQPDPVAAPTLVSRYADQYVRNLEPRLAEMHEQAKGREVEEALSVLYVALTRARSQLYMLVDSAASKSLSFASLLRETLAPSAATEEILFSHGEKDSWQALRPANEAGTRTIQAPAAVPTLAASTSGTRRGVVQEVSRSTTGHSVDLAALMQLESDESSLRSSVLRRLIRSIEWLGEDVPTVEELAAQTHLELDENPTMHSLVGEFASTLKKPEIRQAFQANDPQLESTLQRALPFAFRHEGTTVAGVFPRLELSIKKGKVVAARVFEFDIEENSCKDGVEALLERRRAQLEMYRRAAAHFCDLAEKEISVVLVCLGEGRCITLENTTPKTKANRRG